MSIDWKLLSFRKERRAVAGILSGGQVYELALVIADAAGLSTTNVLEDWPSWSDRITRVVAEGLPASGVPLGEVELLAPLLYPGTVYIAGLNYHDHITEMAERRRSLGEDAGVDALERPWHVIKGSRACVVGTEANVRIPAGAERLDWEAELAVIIGREGRSIPIEAAMDFVAGYAVANDLSARDLSRRSDVRPESTFRIDWLRHKSFDGACPLGPWITPAASGAVAPRCTVQARASLGPTVKKVISPSRR